MSVPVGDSQALHEVGRVQEVSEDEPALDLGALKELCAAATPGPWSADVLGSAGYQINQVMRADAPLRERMQRGVLRVNWLEFETNRANAAFIAAARSALPALIAKVERLTVERDRAQSALEKVRGDVHHWVNPIIGVLRLRQHHDENLTASDVEWAIGHLRKATDACDAALDAPTSSLARALPDLAAEVERLTTERDRARDIACHLEQQAAEALRVAQEAVSRDKLLRTYRHSWALLRDALGDIVRILGDETENQ